MVASNSYGNKNGTAHSYPILRVDEENYGGVQNGMGPNKADDKNRHTISTFMKAIADKKNNNTANGEIFPYAMMKKESCRGIVATNRYENEKCTESSPLLLIDEQNFGGMRKLLEPPKSHPDLIPEPIDRHYSDKDKAITIYDVKQNLPEPPSKCSAFKQGCTRVDNCRLNGALAAFWSAISSTPAVILLAVYNAMLSVPFGASYFSQSVPIGEAARQVLGMRMSFLSLAVGQLVFGIPGMSTLKMVTVWQLGELAPFYHEFADFAASRYESDAILPTTLYLMSMSTLFVGLTFLVIGKLKAGRLISFFPIHVTMGFIAGVGVWMMGLSVFVSSPRDSAVGNSWKVSDGILSLPFLLSAAFAAGIRFLRWLIPRDKFILLDPLYFLSIPFLFYAGLWALGMSYDQAVHLGYFFRDAQNSEESPLLHAAQLWTSFDISKVQWTSIFHMAPKLLVCTILSIPLICPYIPPLAVFLGQESEFSMDREFIAHGYANVVSAILSPGGLVSCSSYGGTVLLSNAGASFGSPTMIYQALAFVAVFVYGPVMVEYIPRCLAGSLLLDLGISLMLEGILDPNNKFDLFEYASIWAVMITMNAIDMTYALIAGLITSFVTYVLQSLTSLKGKGGPIRQAMDASTLSSGLQRNPVEMKILENPMFGRARIAVFCLQGHLFFGNAPALHLQVINFLQKRLQEDNNFGHGFWLVVLDFTLVVKMDASASVAIEKLEGIMKKRFGVSAVLSVARHLTSGSASSETPKLSAAQNEVNSPSVSKKLVNGGEQGLFVALERTGSLLKDGYIQQQFSPDNYENVVLENAAKTVCMFYDTLDEALLVCENILLRKIKIENGHALIESSRHSEGTENVELFEQTATVDILKKYLCSEDKMLLEEILAVLERKVIERGTVLLAAGDVVDTVFFLVYGEFNMCDEEMGICWTQKVDTGSCVGMQNMILRQKQLVSVQCCSETAIVYALSWTSYNVLVEKSPKVAHALDIALIRTLSADLHLLSN